MPRQLFVALLLLVITPLVMLGWLSANAARQGEQAAKDALAKLLSTQLFTANDEVIGVFEAYADDFDDRLNESSDVIETLQEMRRNHPIVRQGIVIGREGQLVFPTNIDLNGRDGAEIAASLSGIIDSRPPLQHANRTSDRTVMAVKGVAPPEIGQQGFSKGEEPRAFGGDSQFSEVNPPSGWQRWYMGDGAQVLYWVALPGGRFAGILLDRSRWLADLIAVLPDDVAALSGQTQRRTDLTTSEPLNGATIGSIQLVDEAKQVVYRWGDRAAFEQPALAVHVLSEPLASWQLQVHVSESLTPVSSLLPLYFSLGGIGLLVCSVGVYVLSSVRRQIADARSRVNFAGQVSHELRTPLTNIRLYTELAELDLERLDKSPQQQTLVERLQVIDYESRRLQRLVSGVLEMIRPSGKRSGVRYQECRVCELVDQIAQQFAPSFAGAGIELEVQCLIEQTVQIDPDVFELILVNLLSNVEKYVPRQTGADNDSDHAGRCEIHCRLESSCGDKPGQTFVAVTVIDNGPGIARRYAKRIFRPFARIDDSISAPSGTGIGLTIAQRAAERHGGELVLLNSSSKDVRRLGGAGFRLLLATGPV
ncbi:sensor histidine kinase [Roseiconus lacunae]|uniref:histidine kinase n=1 Tax=Roseiconus lacunae TaxID=2605694 RepID=A0ABT7PDN4_9BACT|nr:HAMP domain-containing sensor histidine kinase [Roseiconus lacunae]MDM4014453.1 HAMP domain-containing sensor histidine kinase [Roseiconus lacunae]